jgi:subtilase family serine protease
MIRFSQSIWLLASVLAVTIGAAWTPARAAGAAEMVDKVRAAPDLTPVDFEVFLPLRNTATLRQLLVDQQTQGSGRYQKWLTPAEYAAQFGPPPAAMARAQAALKAAGLKISAVHTRSFHVVGSAAQVNRALRTRLNLVSRGGGDERMVAEVRPTLPSALRDEGGRIASFSGLPRKRPFAVRVTGAIPANRYGPDGPYWYNDLKQAYDYPSYSAVLPNGRRLDGTGVRVAVLMSDLLYPGDVATYFDHEHFSVSTGKADPAVSTVLIDGGGSTGGDGSLEASLDVQQVLGGAPGAAVTLVSIPDLSDEHILDGYTYIVDNPQLYDVVNSSFGECELYYTAAYNNGADFTYVLGMYDELFQQGAAEGITFVASSGDNGGLECTSTAYAVRGRAGTFIKGVSTPAASAYVTAVGGGNLVTATPPPARSAAYIGENSFGDPLTPNDPDGVGALATGGYWGAGGGRSTLVPRPNWQAAINTGSTFRTLPDVGMQVGGCPGDAVQPCGPDRSAVVTAYQGSLTGVIGTSVASPEFVSALALYIEKQGHKVGDVHAYLYHMGQVQTAAGGPRAPAASQYYHRNIQGFDGAWAASYPSQNYNYIYGNGSPDVRKLFGLTAYPPAGTPQSSSNP